MTPFAKSALRLGVLGRGRLGTAVARAVAAGGAPAQGLAIAWQVGRGEVPAGPVDVLLDVSVGAAADAHLGLALGRRTPLVLGSTGWSLPDLRERVGARIGVVVAPNFSLTVAFVQRLTALLGRFAALDPAADPYLCEHHRAGKRDAPSGTAVLLAETLLANCPRKSTWTLPPADRPLRADELCVAALRAGHTSSSHVVGVDAPGEVIELVHTARDLSPYANGALQAARFVAGRTGVFAMADVAADRLDPLFRTDPQPADPHPDRRSGR